MSAPAKTEPKVSPVAALIDPNSFEALIDRANAAIEAGDYTLAAELFADAGQVSPSQGDEVLALKGLANALTLSSRHAEAAEAYRRLIELDGSDRTSRFNLAVALTRLRQFSEAEAIYLQLLSEQADFVQARYNLASLYQAQGKLAQARDQWQRVVRQAPQLASAQAALGEVLLNLGKPREATAAYGKAAALAGEDSTIWLGLAVAARAAGDPEQAVVAARRAVQLAEQEAGVWRVLGDVLLDLYRSTKDGRHLSEAVEAWRRSLVLDGSQADLRRALAAIESGGTVAPPVQAASRPVVDNQR